MSLTEAKLAKLRVLNFEDSKNDSELIQAELETAWDEVEMLRVDTRAAFLQALTDFRPDVVLSDFNLPDMNGEEALQIVRQMHPDIPVLMVTGALGDIEAVKLVKLGARDYVMKDHLQRLASAVQSALSLEQGIRARKAAEKSLWQSEADLRALVESSPIAMIVDAGTGADEKILMMNRQFTKQFGYTIEDVPDIDHWWKLAYPDEPYREKLKAEWRDQAERAIRNHEAIEPKETTVTCKDGSIRHVRIALSSAGNKNIVTFEDLTAGKQLEDALQAAVNRNQVMMDTVSDAIVCIDQAGMVYLWNHKAEAMFGYTAAEAIGQSLHQLITPARYLESSSKALRQFAKTGTGPIVGTTRQLEARRKDGSEFSVELSVSSMNIQGEWHATGILRDITERKQAEASLRDSEEKLHAVFEGALDGIVLIDAGARRFVAGNQTICRMLGYSPDEFMRLGVADIHPVGDMSYVIGQFERLERGEIEISSEVPVVRKDGSVFYAEIKASATRFGGKVHMVGIFRDITERKQADAKIKQLNQLYAALSYCNQAIVRSKSEAELFAQTCKAAVQYGGFKMAWIGLLDPATQMVTSVSSFGEAAEEYLRDIKISADAASEFGQGPTGRALRENQPFWCQDFLHSQLTHPWRERGGTLGWKSSASLPLHREGTVFAAFTLYAGEPGAFDQAVRDLLIEMSADIDYALGNFKREAERKQAEASLRKLSLAVEQSPSSIVITDLDANLEYVNEAFLWTTGYSREEVLGKNPRLLHSGKNPRASYDDMWAHLTRGESWKGEFINRRKNGSEYIESTLVTPVRDADGRVSHYLAIKEDITERKRVERSLLESEEIFRRFMEYSPIYVFFKDKNLRVLRLSKNYEAMLGKPVEELLGKSMHEIFPSELALSMDSDDLKILQEGRKITVEEELDGRFYSTIKFPILIDGEPRYLAGYTIDITDRKQIEAKTLAQYEHVAGVNAQLMEANKQLEQTQKQLLQSEKMAAIGLLAAGVAHEINNPVGYVNSNLGTLEKYLADIFVIIDKYEAAESEMEGDNPQLDEVRNLKAKVDLAYLREDIKSLIAESHQGLERVKKIVLDLKEFSHSDAEDQWVWADVHHGLDSTLNVVWNELKYKCEVVKEYGDLPKIYCLPAQLNQVFMNLLVNAAQAIEVRGKITLRTGQDGGRIWVEVSDTGHGIPPKIIPRLFDPFFTTKPVGKGTGLGLSVSYNIVEKHHGSFEVHSEVGVGTTFRVWLPVQQSDNKEKA